MSKCLFVCLNKDVMMMFSLGSVVPRPLLATVFQPIQMAAGGTKAQPIYIAPKVSSFYFIFLCLN